MQLKSGSGAWIKSGKIVNSENIHIMVRSLISLHNLINAVLPLVGGQGGLKPTRMGFQLILIQPGEQILPGIENLAAFLEKVLL